MRGYDIDPGDPASRTTIVLLGLIAEQESIDRAARIKAAYEDRARTGRPKTGGCRMFGYEADAVTIVSAEAEAIRDAAAMMIAGKTLRETVREVFDSRGITATSERPMTPPTLRDILLNPRTRGISTFTPTNPATGIRLQKDRKIVGPGQWPAIIDEATGEQLDAVLRDPARRTSHVGNAPTRYLASVLTCICGDSMYSRSRSRKDGSKQRFYTCKREIEGRKHVSIGAEVDDLVEQVILARMAKPYALELVQKTLAPDDDTTGEQIADLVKKRNELLARRDALDEEVVEGIIDPETFNRPESKIALKRLFAIRSA